MFIKYSHIKFISVGTAIMALVFLFGYFGVKFAEHRSDGQKEVTETPIAYSLINPDVAMQLNKHYIINFLPLKQKLLTIQKRYPQKTYLYFDYLNNASWIGLNERELFTAASTVKVPLAMSLLKAVEDGLLKLSDSYSLNELDLDSDFGELYKVGKDQQFTVENLMEIMLEQSDNTARRAITNIMSNIGIVDPLKDAYYHMGWTLGDMQFLPSLGQPQNQDMIYQKIDLKILSNMFLSLYNADYLSPEDSQKILAYLANTPFNDKIVVGVPKDILIAHKIGTSAGDGTFSDCGIVYAPNRTYLLCLGSNGSDEAQAAKFMAEISKTVYDYVINN